MLEQRIVLFCIYICIKNLTTFSFFLFSYENPVSSMQARGGTTVMENNVLQSRYKNDCVRHEPFRVFSKERKELREEKKGERSKEWTRRLRHVEADEKNVQEYNRLKRRRTFIDEQIVSLFQRARLKATEHCAPVLKRTACIGPKKLGRQQER